MRALPHARRDASHDAMAGVFNRRAAAERLGRERARATRLHTPLSVLMLDIDHFRRINDRWAMLPVTAFCSRWPTYYGAGCAPAICACATAARNSW